MITIDAEIAQMGPLRSTAAALVDYVRAHAQQSLFNRYSGEWTLEPDNWINIHFCFSPQISQPRLARRLSISARVAARPQDKERPLPELEQDFH